MVSTPRFLFPLFSAREEPQSLPDPPLAAGPGTPGSRRHTHAPERDSSLPAAPVSVGSTQGCQPSCPGSQVAGGDPASCLAFPSSRHCWNQRPIRTCSAYCPRGCHRGRVGGGWQLGPPGSSQKTPPPCRPPSLTPVHEIPLLPARLKALAETTPMLGCPETGSAPRAEGGSAQLLPFDGQVTPHS